MVETVASELGRWSAWHADAYPLRLGVSSCLLGENVRYDGGHCRDGFLVDTLGRWFELVPVCPEVELGMTIPRPTIRLVEGEGGTRLVAPSSGQDFTAAMQAFAQRKVDELKRADLDGYVVKRGSPSCGLERIRVYRGDMPVRRDASGLYTRALAEAWPALPIEEDGRLNDVKLRENFIERVFGRNRWRALVGGGLSRRRLVEFHTAHKLLIRAHDEAAYQRLGRLVGSAGTIDDAELYRAYELELQAALCTRSTARSHVNVLQHALGYLKTLLEPREKREILAAVEDFRRGLLPLVVPLSLLRYEIRRHDVAYLAGQLYFDPHPKELMLRNHA